MTLALLRRALEPAKITLVGGSPEIDVLATQIRSGSYRGDFNAIPDVTAFAVAIAC